MILNIIFFNCTASPQKRKEFATTRPGHHFFEYKIFDELIFMPMLNRLSTHTYLPFGSQRGISTRLAYQNPKNNLPHAPDFASP